MLNLDNFDEHGRMRPLLDSPRSLEACKRQGIEPSQLLIRQLHEMKEVYKDGMNDKKSLQIKLEHYQMRRRKKLELVREERMRLIEDPPNMKSFGGNRFDRTVYKEIENKLEKKKIMDEVKQEIKRKQIEIKDMETQNKLRAVEQKRLQQRALNKQKGHQKETRKNVNIIHHEMDKIEKINNWMETKEEKQWKVKKAEEERLRLIEQKKRQKQEYYNGKSNYATSLKNFYQDQKEKKYRTKEEYMNEIKQQQERRAAEAKKAVDEQRRKDNEWKETKKKEAELEERKKQETIMDNIKKKEYKKDTVLGELERQKEMEDAIAREDKERKAALVRDKKQQDQFELEKRRKIMEYRQKLQKEEEDRRAQEIELQNRMKAEQKKQRQKKRMFILEETEKQEYLKGIFIEERYGEKAKLIEQKQRERSEKEREKALMKRLKEQEAQENAKRREVIKKFEKEENLKRYEEKIKAIQEQKEKIKYEVKIKRVDRGEIESKIYSEEKIKQEKSKEDQKSNERPTPIPKPTKKQASQDRQKQKSKLKKDEIRKLIQNLKIQCNRQEFKLMQQEQQVEKERKQLEETADNVTELKRLQKIHGVQRARFQERLNQFIKKNQAKVEAYKKSLDSEL